MRRRCLVVVPVVMGDGSAVRNAFRAAALFLCTVAPLWLLALPAAAVVAQSDTTTTTSALTERLWGSRGTFEHPVARDAFDRGLRAVAEAQRAARRMEDPQRSEAERERLRRTRNEAVREAARLMQRILDDAELRQAVLFDEGRGRFVGASVLVRATLLEHGEVAVDAYREHIAADAAHELRRARQAQDPARMLEVVLRYPFGETSLSAGIAVARLLWEAGRHESAAALCRRLLARKDELNEEQAALLATVAAYAYGHLGQVPEAREMLRLVEARLPEARVATGHRTQPLRRVAQDQLERATLRADEAAGSWLMQASDKRGQHLGHGEVESLELQWHEHYHDPTRNGPVEHYRPQYPDFRMPRRFPVANAELLVVPNRTGVRVYGLRDGDERWGYDVEVEPTRGSRAHGRTGGFWLDERSNRDPASIDTATLAGDDVYVSIEQPMRYELHDPLGIDHLRHHNHRRSGAFMIPFAPRRALYRFEASTGELRWRIGASWKDRDDPVHETLSYTTAPVVIDERVYASAAKVMEENAHIFVLALSRDATEDDATPRVHWKTKVGTGLQETNMFGRPTREPVPSALAYESHRLFVSTNIGTVTALDTLTGEQLWSFPYERIRFVTPVSLNNHYRELTWFNMPPLVHDGHVVAAPMDSRYLYCLDAATGEKLWALPWQSRSPRDTPRHLVGIHDGRLYWTCERFLYRTALDPDDLESDEPLIAVADITGTLRTRITGRPIIINGTLHAATSDDHIVRLDLARGRHQPPVRRGIGSIGGNLAFAHGTLIASNDEAFGVAYHDDEDEDAGH